MLMYVEFQDILTLRRELQGVTVEFSDGAEVIDVELALDFSIAQIAGLPDFCTVESVVGLLAAFGFSAKAEEVRLRSFDDRAVAELKVKDPKFSDYLIKKFHKQLGTSDTSELSVSKIRIGGWSFEASNRMQLSSVTCAWYKPSQTAWLHYHDSHAIHPVKEIIEKQPETVFGSKIKCSITDPRVIAGGRYSTSRQPVYSVQVSGLFLNTSTTKKFLDRLLAGSRKPYEIKWGLLTSKFSQDALETKVRNMLEKPEATSGNLSRHQTHPAQRQ